MKRLKKIVSIVLTAVMVLAMCIPVMAEGAATFTITGPLNGHTYEVYQIFIGDLVNKDGVKTLSNIKWGANSTGTEGEKVLDSDIDALLGDHPAKQPEQYVNFSSTPVATIDNANSTANVVAGYYLIKDKDETVPDREVYTEYIVKVAENIDITPKGNVPSFEKKIKDKNDSTGDQSGWQDSADYDIGDSVPFKLEGKVADNYDKYKTYYFAFHDIEEKGLTFEPGSVEVYIDGTKIDASNYTVVTNPTDGCSFEVKFADLKKTPANANSIVRVEYTSKLNEEANLGQEGNVNKAKLQFSNKPSDSQGGENSPTGETPWDNVIVFTYKVVVNKYANSVAEGNRLTGAEFTLTKKIKDGEDKVIAVVKSEDGTTFTFKGLDDGEYVLTETKTPDTYNTIPPMTFKVNADHTITWDGENRNNVLTSLTGERVSGEITFETSQDKSTLSTNVINKSGSTLPETGGIGTTVFYVVGVILMLGAGVLLVTKKRMSSNR